jgi:uroporphyrinogen-III decarboxylase
MGIGSAIGFVSPGAQPDVRAAFQAIFDAGMELARWGEIVGACSREVLAAGFPSIRGASALAPFDSIADILRGTVGVSKDMYRQPDKLLEAMEKISDLTIKQTIATANAFEAVAVGMPLHKGDDTFMSDKQFETFYWPTLKKLILAFIEEGLMVMPAAEGRYNRRLEVIQDLPKGWTHWMFDQTDMARAKKIVGKNACISGNVPSSLMMTGTPQDVKEYCRKLIEVCGEGGGYILSGGSAGTETNPGNLRAFMQAAKEYGTYR